MYIYKILKESMKSEKCVIELLIKPSFREDVCFQVYHMEKDVWKMFWITDFTIHELIDCWREFSNLYLQYKDITTKQLLEIEDFQKFMLGKMVVHEKILSSQEREMVIKLLNEGIPEVVHKPGGLDGHGYRIKIYGNEIIERDCWCVLPKEWEHLVPFIDFATGIANLNQDIYGVYGVSTK